LAVALAVEVGGVVDLVVGGVDDADTKLRTPCKVRPQQP
jgi:hypothetical protein